MITNPFNKQEFAPNSIYIIKCLVGVVICYIPYVLFPQYPFYWAIVSVALALSPDHSTTQAYNRIKANVLGCAVGISLYPLHLPNMLILCIGIALTISIGLALNIKDALRSALAAVVLLPYRKNKASTGTLHWKE